MAVVNGKDGILLIEGEAVACGRSVSITTSTELIETTTAGSGKGATFYPIKNNSTGSFEGVVFLLENNKWTLPELRKKQLEGYLFSGTMTRTDQDGNSYTDAFDFYITNITDTAASGDFNTFNFDFQINGDPLIDVFCNGLTEVTGLAISVVDTTPIIVYEATWAGGGGLTTFEVSTDGGTTWTAKTGILSGNTFQYNFNSNDYTNHKLRIKCECQHDDSFFYTQIATFNFVCGIAVTGLVISIEDLGGGDYEYTGTYTTTGGTATSYKVEVKIGLDPYTEADPPLTITTAANSTTVKYKLNGGVDVSHNLKITPYCSLSFAGTPAINTWDI